MTDARLQIPTNLVVYDPLRHPFCLLNSVGALEVPAGAEIKLEPGGYHIMLMELAAPLQVGDEFVLTLQFEDAGETAVDVTVGDR